MTTTRRAAALIGPALLVVLLGCSPVADPPGPGGSSSTAAAAPAVGAESPTTPAPAVTASGSRVSSLPSVPQYRATLPPAVDDTPAPARFAAPSVQIRLKIIKTGVAENGQMQLPDSNREVAWYEFGSRPADAMGTTVLAAHVDTRAEGLGPFARLRELRPGQEITIADTNGQTQSYAVTAVTEIQKSKVVIDELFRRDGPPELKVLTCGGPYSRETGYRDNIIVSASPR